MKTIWKRRGMTGCGTKALGFVLSLVCSGCILGVSLSGAAPFFDNTGDGFSPRVMVQGREGCFLAADGFNKVIWQVTEEGRSIYAGQKGAAGKYGEPRGGYRDGSLGEMLIGEPWDMIPYLDGYALSDRSNHVVRYISPEGAMTAAGTGKAGYEDNLASKALFAAPTGLAAGPDGILYIADTDNDVVRSLSLSGKVDTYLRGLSAPTGICFYEGALYVADTGNNRIVKAMDGAVVWSAGTGEDGFADGPVSQAMFSGPQRMTAAEDGALYVSDTGNSVVRKIWGDNVSTLPAADAADPDLTIASPEGMMVMGDHIYLCDSFLRKVFVLPR